jgi:ribonuclease P protein component
MLKKSSRLNTEQVKMIMEKGRMAHSPLFTLRFITNPKKIDDKNKTIGIRFAAIISKKTAKTAVVRNKMRRRVYGALGGIIGKNNNREFLVNNNKKSLTDDNQKILINSNGTEIISVIICKPKALDADFAMLSNDLKILLNKAGVL